MKSDVPSESQRGQGLQLPRPWRWAAYLVLALVLAAGFAAYLKPDMVVMWDTLLTLCGF